MLKIQHLLQAELFLPPQKLYVEFQTPSTQIVTLFGNRIFIEVRGKTKSLGWVLIQYQCVLIERGNLNMEPTQREDNMKSHKENVM